MAALRVRLRCLYVLAGGVGHLPYRYSIVARKVKHPRDTDSARTNTLYKNGGQSVVEAIRQSAPQDTIIVTCGDYSNPDDLVRMPELAGSNYIVNFHYYQPHIFTTKARRGESVLGDAATGTVSGNARAGTNRCFETNQ
jgi:hypothetical protein